MFEGTHGEVSVLPKWVRFVAKKVYDHTHHVYEISETVKGVENDNDDA
jgi:hypothetical protein